ncbi:redoxin domain-containing protein [Fulvivirga sp. M361]|uniref:redoxin family protein n=1 Tax=Fulvivirga sp. M361 TaxID=2594266 RepID=UPI001179E76E|nr:redoxin family protein [Fulvivirga sp. M361]TRX59215.1 redoxin domain-containing protein [Fulvivirga sp. M361]
MMKLKTIYTNYLMDKDNNQMANKKFVLLFSALLILFSSCQDTSKKQTIAQDLTKEFTANPVKIEKQEVVTLAIGADAPDFNLPNLKGEFMSLKNFEQAEILVMIFTCNHCPTSQAYENRIIEFTKEYKDKGVAVVAVNSASPLGLMYPESSWSDVDDSYEDMKIRARDRGFNFPYLYDGDLQEASLSYGAMATPHIFILDKERKLRYQGRIDADQKQGVGKSEDLIQAVEELLAGKEVSNPVTKSIGCSTKWSWKADNAKALDERWAKREVALNEIDNEGVKELLANNTEKLQLINVWASWCAPCVVEFPDLVKLQRMYGKKDFQFISLSVDKMEIKDKVLKFLKEEQAAVENYIYSQGDLYELIELVDPDWSGALPYTLLVEPGGKKVYTYQGAVELLELRKAIVDHELIGRYR